ncbi:MAG: carboxypeptidase-like regulatory domain-containing protein, partial [Candidatus Marinimicrobia bacterium]|nr:carboxypeptidase-like regulatory domain-containing protein [Candidatus Neomarinimicrobiota bacterium]
MRIKRIKTLAIALILITISTMGIAGTKGKIFGTAIEKSTGDPLIGVNVVIESTDLGGVTDQDGRYLIMNVPVSVYSLQFSFIGYRVVTVKNVQVIQDMTTEINVE